jgi:hypothetical protein
VSAHVAFCDVNARDPTRTPAKPEPSSLNGEFELNLHKWLYVVVGLELAVMTRVMWERESGTREIAWYIGIPRDKFLQHGRSRARCRGLGRARRGSLYEVPRRWSTVAASSS